VRPQGELLLTENDAWQLKTVHSDRSTVAR
jgi:hypothetical protein